MAMTLKRILVVEDNDDIRGLFRLALALDGFEVIEARTGLDAIQLFETNPPDLVVLDLGLPDFDGFAVHQEIAAQSNGRHTPIIVVTSSPRDLSHLAIARVLRKPVMPDELVMTVRRYLT
jgi:DNA-binding response OmpR family regulator